MEVYLDTCYDSKKNFIETIAMCKDYVAIGERETELNSEYNKDS